jgi:uncharacterized SAM-binding protein YcdF (DUF218 family)
MTDQELAEIVWDYMRYEQPLEKADLILGLGNQDIRTAEWAAQLWKDGWAPRILFTGNQGVGTRHLLDRSEADWFASRARELGVHSDALLLEHGATNTSENVTLSYRLLFEQDLLPKKMIVVTKPYMLRRAYATFMKQWPEERRPEVIMSAMNISLEDYCKSEMYPFDYVVNIMVGDLQRIMEYPKRGFQIEQYVPDEVKRAFDELVKRGYDKHLL